MAEVGRGLPGAPRADVPVRNRVAPAGQRPRGLPLKSQTYGTLSGCSLKSMIRSTYMLGINPVALEDFTPPQTG